MRLHLFSLIIALTYSMNLTWASQCVEQTTKVELPEEYLHANYVRLSPNGKHLIATFSDGGVGLLKIDYSQKEGYNLKHIKNALNDEAFPVEPEWKFISSPYHDDGTMKYYVLKDIEERQEMAEPVFSSYFNEFYHSIGGDENGFSVTRWSFLGTRDYVTKDSNIIKESDTYSICPNLYDLPKGFQKYRTIFNTIFLYVTAHISANEEVYDFWDRALADMEKKFNKEWSDFTEEENVETSKLAESYLTEAQRKIAWTMVEKGRSTKKEYELYIELLDKLGNFDESDLEEITEFILEQPILSPNRDMIAGLYNEKMRVYKINNDKTCTEVGTPGFRTSKVSFSYNDSYFTDRLVAYYYERENDESFESGTTQFEVFNITKNKSYGLGIEYGEAYPNLTKDGRAIYLNSTQMVVVDLNSVSNGEIGGAPCLLESKLEAIYADPNKR